MNSICSSSISPSEDRREEIALEGEIVGYKTKQDTIASKSFYGITVARPNYHYEVIGKETLLGKLGLGRPGRSWDVVGIRKVYDE